MESNPDCTICYHQHEAFESKTGKIKYLSFDKHKSRRGDVKVAVKYGTFNGALTSMVRRNKTPKNGFNPLVPVASDWLYWVETLSNGGTIDYIDDVLARYRRHANNLTNKGVTIGQNSIDHMNSCNLILKDHPELFCEILYRYGQIVIENRKYLPYLKSLWFGFKMTCNYKALIGALTYIVTLGKVKL
jgi:hypothetical protein